MSDHVSGHAAIDAWMTMLDGGETDIARWLSPDAVLDWLTSPARGAEAVLAFIPRHPFLKPALYEGVNWLPVEARPDGVLQVRGLCPPDRMFPGGRATAVDFAFRLDGQGRIATVSVHPHHSEPADVAPALAPGQTAPAFVLPDVFGHETAFPIPGAAATIVLWTGNQCPFARAWHDRIQSTIKDYAGRGVRALQINANDPSIFPADSLESCRARAGDFAGPYLVDAGQAVARGWGARRTPEVFIVGPDQVVAYHGAPDGDFNDKAAERSTEHDAEWLREALDAVLEGRPVARPDTAAFGCNIKWTFPKPESVR